MAQRLLCASFATYSGVLVQRIVRLHRVLILTAAFIDSVEKLVAEVAIIAAILSMRLL